MRDYDLEIKKLEDEIVDLRKEKELFGNKEDRFKLAELLHEKQCHANHTDHCDWSYGSWNKLNYFRTKYLEKAVNMLNDATYNEIIKVLKFL